MGIEALKPTGNPVEKPKISPPENALVLNGGQNKTDGRQNPENKHGLDLDSALRIALETVGEKETYTTTDVVSALNAVNPDGSPTSRQDKTKQWNRISKALERNRNIIPSRTFENGKRSRINLYTRDDFRQILTTILTKNIVSRETPIQARDNRDLGKEGEASIKAMRNNLGDNEWMRIKEAFERIKQQLITDVTYSILSHLQSSGGINELDKDAFKLLHDNFPRMKIARNFRLKKREAIACLLKLNDAHDSGEFLSGSFAQKLEGLWNKDPKSAVTIKDREIIKICQELKEKQYDIETIVETVCNHFHIGLPEKYQTKTV